MVLRQTTKHTTKHTDNNTDNHADNQAWHHTPLAKDTCLGKDPSKRRICIYDGELQIIRAYYN